MKKPIRDLEPHRKLGDKRNELALKHRKAVRNFSQSKDVREDRGMRQSKLGSRQPMFGRR